jgi:hypothetical protein
MRHSHNSQTKKSRKLSTSLLTKKMSLQMSHPACKCQIRLVHVFPQLASHTGTCVPTTCFTHRYMCSHNLLHTPVKAASHTGQSRFTHRLKPSSKAKVDLCLLTYKTRFTIVRPHSPHRNRFSTHSRKHNYIKYGKSSYPTATVSNRII